MKQQRHPIFDKFWLTLTILNCVNDVVGAYCCYYKYIYNYVYNIYVYICIIYMCMYIIYVYIIIL